jgi:Rrf2 family protein
MKVNTKIRYGIRVMIELALNINKAGVFQKDIAKNQDISFKYLDQIIAGLKSSGLVTTVTGKKSGYRLTREAGKITVFDIFNAFNEEFSVVDCLVDESKCKKNSQCATREFWQGLNENIISYLKSTTIDDLAKKQIELSQQKQELHFYI